METPVHVNACWSSPFLGSAGWNLDADDHPLNRLDMQNATSRALLGENSLIPEVNDLSVAQQRRVRDTLRYALKFFSKKEWENSTRDELPDTTDAPEELFTDVWGMSFPGEPWHLESDEGASGTTTAGIPSSSTATDLAASNA